MKRVVCQIVVVLFLGLVFLGQAFASECVIDNDSTNPEKKGALVYFLNKVWEDGSCKTEGEELQKKYSEFIGHDGPYHVIRFKKSIDIFALSLPPLHGRDGLPLLLVANEGAVVRIVGSQDASGIVLRYIGGSVILENITIEGFGGHGVRIDSDNNLLINVKVKDNGYGQLGGHGIYITGKNNKVVNAEIRNNALDGIVVGHKRACNEMNSSTGYGDETGIFDTEVSNNGQNPFGERDGFGLYINADGVIVGGINDVSGIKENRLSAAYIESSLFSCAGAASEFKPRKVILSKTTMEKNGDYNKRGSAVVIAGRSIPPPAGVAAASDPTGLVAKIVGRVPYRRDEPFWLINPDEIEVDVYRLNGAGEPHHYIGTFSRVSNETGEFAYTIEDVEHNAKGSMAAIALDRGNHQTSHLSESNGSSFTDSNSEDTDGDLLKDFDEAKLGTDPFNPDSDFDGLMDGEEVHLKGYVGGLIGEGVTLGHPDQLDPKNPDSDGDCLPDGLELGVSLERLNDLRTGIEVNKTLNLNPVCETLLKDNAITDMKNAIWIDEYALHKLSNVSGLFDIDPQNLSDPTLTDSDGDGLSDGAEDWNYSGDRDKDKNDPEIFVEPDPMKKDSDGDTIIDGDEGDRNGNDSLDPFESSPQLADTDNDGVSDSDEVRKGTFPNSCDSDQDGLPDGIEFGVTHAIDDSNCRGLQSAGTNFYNIGILDGTRKDSDGDGILDGEEDLNKNGWIDEGETDPTTVDTDEDGINDYIENTGDLDGDGVFDIDPFQLSNGSECSPPLEFRDADCDGLPNATDADSDNDGCLDRDESILNDGNMNGISDPYDSATLGCGSSSGGGGGAGGVITGSGSASPKTDESEGPVSYLSNNPQGGGACSLVLNSREDCISWHILFLLLFLITTVKMFSKVNSCSKYLATFLNRVR